MQFGEHVAVQSGDDILLFVVRRQAVQSENDAGDPEAARTNDEPQQRPAPAGAAFVVHRWGDCRMAVDFPADRKNADARCLVLLTLFWNAILGCLAVIVTIAALVQRDPSLRNALLVPILFGLGSIGVMMISTMRATCTHENLTITPTTFNIKRMIDLKPRHRDSVNNADEADAVHSRLDKVFCKQVSGQTDDLTKAEIKERSNGEFGSDKYFALMEGQKEHKLWHFLSAAETEWLVSEINEVLHNIRQRTGNRPGNV